MNDEINIKLGGDTSGFAAALRGASGMADSFVHHVKESFQEAFHHLFAPLSIAGAFEAVHSLMEEVETIKRISESTGLDTGITQDLLNLGKASGVAADQIESMMAKFVKKLAPGEDPEEALMKIADRMSEIEDPTERARLATEAFGKSGAKLIPILEQGAEGIRKMSEEWGKLSEAEIDQIEHAEQSLKQAGQRSKVILAQIIDGFKTVTSEFDKMPIWKKISGYGAIEAYRKAFNTTPSEEEMAHDNAKEAQKVENARKAVEQRKEDAIKAAKELAEKEEYIRAKPEEKVLMLTRQILAARRELEGMGDEDEKARKKVSEDLVSAEEKRHSIQKQIADEEKRAQKERDTVAKEILKTEAQIAKLGRDRQRERMSEFMPSVQEVAQSGFMTFRHNQWEFQQGPFAQMARRLLNLQDDAKQSLIYGNRDRFNQDVSQIDQLKKSLTEAGVMSSDDKLTDIDEKIKEGNKHLADLKEKAETGFVVKGQDDE